MRSSFFATFSIYFAWIVSLSALLGSMFFSEVMGFAPCSLCWYQRIFMFPLVIILLIGIVSSDKKVYKYVLPIAAIGGVIAFYHLLLQNNMIAEPLTPCTLSGLCKEKYINYLGFVTIPFLSLASFLIIFISTLHYAVSNKQSIKQ